MKLHNAVQDQPIVSNVGEIGEFRIRNSAKAFSILSSGLYANKIRAIIRELSCNAVDSHVAAGKTDTPFDVHLPNQLEPWFSIRDYGTGLTHEQVKNIYTTYFESTKTASNEFIGALGLGSKSPFSYTDNFTVTAIQGNKKGIYTAFINEQGVPSIALMMEEETTDPNGVEVKFSVNDRYDFDKFKTEARAVYKWFKQRPVISGVSNFQVDEIQYETKDIIPGVHSQSCGRDSSTAIMGNIAYPINIPESDNTLGDLRKLLRCNLVIEFSIGELDFQASREGLSYIPETIAAIKNKLEALNAQLAVHVKQEADKITNIWDKTILLVNKGSHSLWETAVQKYIADTKFEYIDTRHNWLRSKIFNIEETALQGCNIMLRRFSKSRHNHAAVNGKITHSYDHTTKKSTNYWDIPISASLRFVVNDTRIGATERAKYHFKTTTWIKDNNLTSVDCFVIEPFDKTKSIDLAAFKQMIANPPESYFMQASSLVERERSNGTIGRNVTIMRLEESDRGGWRNRNAKMVWRDAGKASNFVSDATYYYIPLSGYQALNRCTDVKNLHNQLIRSKVFTGDVYGVRKTDIEYIKKQKNWVELDVLIVEKLAKMDKENVMGLVKQSLDINDMEKYNSKYINQNSPFAKLLNTFKDIKAVDSQVQLATQWLCKMYDVKTSTSPQALIDKYTQEVMTIKSRYPLLKSLYYTAETAAVAEYINLIDAHKGV